MAVDPLVAAMLTASDTPTPVRLQYGIVTAVSGGVFVRVGAGTAGLFCRRLGSYTAPVVGHFVAVLVVGADRLCLGNVV